MIRGTRYLLLLCLAVGLRGLMAQSALQHQDQRRLADGLYSRGLYDLALEEYRSLLEQVPKVGNREALFFRAAESARQLGKTAPAKSFYTETITADPESDLAQRSRYRMAEIAYEEGKSADAGRWLKELLQVPKKTAIQFPARYLLGQVLEADGAADRARDQYKLLIKQQPEGELAGYAALRLAVMGGTSPEERREAFQLATERAASDEMRLEALLGLAKLETSERNTETAANLYWDIWTRFPDQLRGRNGLPAVAWSQVQAGRFRRALDLLEETSAEERKAQAETWAYLEAVSLQRLDRSEEALGAYTAFVESFPESRFRDIAGYEAAALSAAAGDHEQVLRYAQEVRNVPGREVEGLWLLAESARAAGKTADAVDVYSELIREYPESKRAPDAWYLKALLADENDPRARAENLEAFARNFPQDSRGSDALRMAGGLYLDLEDYAKGYACWKEAGSRMEKADAGFTLRTALLAVRLEKDQEAREALQRTLDLNLPRVEKATAHYWLGVVLERNGQTDSAADEFSTALTLNPKADWTDRARMRLGRYYQQTDQEKKALKVFLPLMDEEDPALPDGLLTWLLDVAQRESTPQEQVEVAEAMQQTSRPAILREIGAYAEAVALMELDQTAGAIQAWQRGLDFDSHSLESAEAALALGRAYLGQEKWDEALSAFRRAASTASSLELGRIQAEALAGLGQTELGRENWEVAGRHFLSVSVLFDDPDLVPGCLSAAAEAFERAGQPDRAAAARRERRERYPDAAEAVPTLTPEVTL